MESIPYIFPIESPEAQYLPLKITKIKCEIDFQVINKNDYGNFMDTLKMDYQNVIRYLIKSGGIPNRWLDFGLPNDSQEYVIFNVLIKNGYKKIESSGRKLLYGHHFLLIFSLPENGFNYNKIKQYIESFIKPKNHHFSLSCFSQQQLQNDQNFPVQLITDFNQQYLIPFNQIQPIFTETLKNSPYLIKIIPFKERSPKSKEILIRAIQILTTLFKVKTIIVKNFHKCAIGGSKDRHQILSAKMSTYIISKATTRLSNAIKFRHLHKVAAYISSIYSNITIIEERIKYKMEKYFEKIRKFPKLSFGDELLRSLKTVYEIFKLNLIIFKNKWFFQWNESTKMKIAMSESGKNSIGIIVTEKHFPPETFYSHFCNENLFWAINEENNFIKGYGTDNNDAGAAENIFSEPLLYFNENEQNFGIVTSQISTETISTLSRQQISCGLLIDICKCGCDKIRYWLCENCCTLVSRLSNERIMCGCQKQSLNDIKKWCFKCMLASPDQPSEEEQNISSQIVSFAELTQDSASLPSRTTTFPESKKDLSFPPSTLSSRTQINTTRILIVQIKREKISNGLSTPYSPSNKSLLTPSIPKSLQSNVTLASSESDDESDNSLNYRDTIIDQE